MPERTLRGCRILVVEDEYMLAYDLRTELAEAGAVVLGPVGNVAAAIEIVEREAHLDGAVMDVNLHGELAFPIADLLIARAVPFLFTTGYDASAIPSRFEDVVRCEKPVDVGRVARAIGRVIHD